LKSSVTNTIRDPEEGLTTLFGMTVDDDEGLTLPDQNDSRRCCWRRLDFARSEWQ